MYFGRPKQAELILKKLCYAEKEGGGVTESGRALSKFAKQRILNI